MKILERRLEDLGELAGNMQQGRDARPDWLQALDVDPTSVYYRFLYHCSAMLKPSVSFEIGTCEGKSAAHLAAGCPSGTVITIDIRRSSKAATDQLLVPNLISIVGDSLQVPSVLKWMPQLDLLFIDGVHELSQAYREYLMYRPYVKEGGLIFFDDIHINPGMDQLWELVRDPKQELPTLHYTGFGVAAKDPSVEPISLEEVVPQPA